MESVGLDNLFNGIYKDKTVFVTGHTGFKGSWLVEWLKLLGAKVVGFSLEPNTNPSHFDLFERDYTHLIGDINKCKSIEYAIIKHQPDIVFHLAAQPLVRASYHDPNNTFQTNVMGTLNLYEAIRKTPSVQAVVCVTTDKVYSNQETNKAFKENNSLGGYDPYSASKACVEILTDSYRKSFFQDKSVLIATARAGNVIGGGDWAQDRLVPDIIKNIVANETVFIRNPTAIRPWQHVLESLSGYLLLGQKLLDKKIKCATAWNFGPELEDCRSVENVLNMMQAHWQKIIFKVEKASLHEAQFLKLDSTQSKKNLGWQPIWSLDEAIEKTVIWYKSFYENKDVMTQKQILEYCALGFYKSAIWA